MPATPTTLRFLPLTERAVQQQRVYVKTRWEDAWVRDYSLWCSEAVWTAAPTIPAATLTHRYGVGMNEPTAVVQGLRQRWVSEARYRDQLRLFVKVEFERHVINDAAMELPLRWYGTVEVELDDTRGVLFRSLGGQDPQAYLDGQNHFTCYGLESLLDYAEVRTSMVRQASGGGFFTVKRGLEFNADGKPNCNLAAGTDDLFLFHHSRDRSAATFWTTSYAVYYLLRSQAGENFPALPFSLYDLAGILPDWDLVRLATDGRTVRELLNTLIPRQRLMGWRLVPLEALDPTGTTPPGQDLLLIPFSFAAEDITLDAELSSTVAPPVLKANPDQFKLAYERDRGCRAAIKRSSNDACDRVIVRGAQRTSTGTFCYNDGTLTDGWPAALKTEYNQGASTALDYPAAGEIEYRAYRNQRARERERLASVFSRFLLPVPFLYYVWGGLSPAPTAKHLLTFDQENSEGNGPHADADPQELAPEDLQFLPRLALKSGYDYSGSNLSGDPDDIPETAAGVVHDYLLPLVVFPDPGLDQIGAGGVKHYRRAERASAWKYETMGEEDLQLWSARVRVDHEDGALWVVVASAEQHAIARTDFVALAGAGEITPPADYKQMLATLTVAWSDRVEVQHPADTPEFLDHVRDLVVDLGAAARLDYVAPKTIVGLDAKGEVIRTDSGGYVRDDRPMMEGVARIAFEWYSKTRRVLTLTCSRLNSALEIGDYIQSVGDVLVVGENTDEINGVVTQIRVAMPKEEGEGPVEPAVPSITYETSYGELDVLKLVPHQEAAG